MDLTIIFANDKQYKCDHIYIEPVTAYKTERHGIRAAIIPDGVSLDELNETIHDSCAVANITVRNNEPVQNVDENGEPVGEPFIATEELTNYIVPGDVVLSVEETDEGARYIVRLAEPTKAEIILLQMGYTDPWGF